MRTSYFGQSRNINKDWMKAVVDCERQAKPAYFEYRDALTPLAACLQPDRFYGTAGTSVRVRAWILNDTPDAPQGATLRYQLECDGKTVATGTHPADIRASEATCQGALAVAFPATDKRRNATLRLGLFDKNGVLLHDTAMPLDVIPAKEKAKARTPGGKYHQLIR